MNRHEMTLLGLNEEFAFVSSGDETTPFDSKAAAIDLLKVRNWRGLVGFLAKHAINREMAWCWNDGLDVRRLFGGAHNTPMIYSGAHWTMCCVTPLCPITSIKFRMSCAG